MSCTGVREAYGAVAALRTARAVAVAGGLEVCFETVRVLPLIEQLFA